MMKKIWEFTPQAVACQKLFEEDMKARDDLKHSMANKLVELDSFVCSIQPGKVI